jgi:adhesin/invasin
LAPCGGGVSVTFTTTLGEVFPPSNETDLAGETYFFLRSGYQLGTARVVARAGTSARGEATVNFYPRNASSILLTASPNSMAADGYSTSTLVASVYDSTFRPVADGTPVRFVLSDTAYGVVVPQIAYTTSGNAQAIFRSAVHKGSVDIRAEVSPPYI